MILPTPRPHSANRPATASLLVGVSAPFAQSPITCVDRSGSLRTPKETSGTLGALLTALPPHVRLPIFAHDPATAPPAALTSSSKSSSAQFQIPFLPSTHRLPLVVCRVLCCGACSSSTSPCQLLLSGTQPPDPRLTRLPPTQSADCLSARIRKNEQATLTAFFHASSIHPFFSADHSKSWQQCASPPHFRLPTHITTCSAR